MTTTTGQRFYIADVERHNGKTDSTGNPTYRNDSDWEVIVSYWPCAIITKAEFETSRGRQVTSDASHLFVGDRWQIVRGNIDSTCRIRAHGNLYDIVGIHGLSGNSVEAEIETRQET